MDRQLSRVAVHALRWYVDAQDDNDSQGRLLPTTKAADRSRQRQRGSRDNKEDPQQESRLVVWRRYVACYKMLESEGEQHLVDPVLPIVAGLCAAVHGNDDQEEEEEDN